MEKEGTPQKRRRVVLVPPPFQGHITPMLQLGSILHSRGFSITIAHPEFNAPVSSTFPEFFFLPLPDNVSGLDTSFWNLLEVLAAINVNCKAPFQRYLIQMMEKQDTLDDQVCCIIYDAIMHFADDVANHLRIPSVILRTANASTVLAWNATPRLLAQGFLPFQGSPSNDLEPELNPLRFKDLPFIGSLEDAQFVANLSKIRSSSAIVWNTMDFLEHSSLSQLEQQYQIPSFPIGPLHKIAPASTTSLFKEDTSCLTWLDKQAPNSVIYVSLGSLAMVGEKELAETAWGLANSNQPFLWVVRPGLVVGLDQWVELFLKDFKESVKERGHIVKWAPQREVLAHGGVGWFWSHCGWNSTLESMYEGVPMICRPWISDQKVNTRYITHVWRVGIEMEGELERGGIERVIRRLVVEKEGEEIRQRAIEMGEKIKSCLKKGGSSYNSLNNFEEFILSQSCSVPDHCQNENGHVD